jgi:hypothetical protein
MGELITIVDPQTSRITLVVIVDCVKASDIGSVYVRQGPGGPILFDLKPQMQLHSFDPFGHALAVGDAALPVTVSQAIAAGHTWVSVQVASHPDGQITGALGGAPAGPFDSYCTAGTSSLGCVPAMHGIGTPSASGASGFQLACNDLEAQKTGLLFYGVSGPHAVSWGGGSTSYVCVQAPTQRTPAQSSGGTPGQCDGALMVDWNAFQASHPGALGQPFSAGQTIWSQAWYRDPPAVKSTNLSDGLSFTLGP